MAFAREFHRPWRSSKPITALGGVWDCAIDGRPFLFDRTSDGYKQGVQSIPVLRTQSDTSDKPGESSINREDLWRAGQSSWHHGAGQRIRDVDNADPERFWASQGINVWKRNELSLLNKVGAFGMTAGLGSKMTVAQYPFAFFLSDTSIYRNDSSLNQTAECNVPTGSGTMRSVATDGINVWVTASGRALKGSTGSYVFTEWLAQSLDLVAYVRGRLIVTQGKTISEVTGGTTLNSLNASESNTNLKWVDITEGTSAIYAAANSGGTSTIYRIAPASSSPTGLLTAPIPAAPALPVRETITALYGYLGRICIGTTKGIRVAEEDGSGNLTIGPLIEMKQPVNCFSGDGQYVYFGMSQIDDVNGASTASGLGRLDLGQQTDTGVYAWASDVYTTETGPVVGCAVLWNGYKVFAVSGKRVYLEYGEALDTGWLRSGLIRYGIVDDKVARRVELRHAKLRGSVSVDLAVDENTFVNLGESNLEGTVTPTVGFTSTLPAGTNHEVRVTLKKGTTGSPVVQNIELRADPVPTRGITIWTAVMLTEASTTHPARHPLEDYDALVALANYKRAITYQVKSKIFNVTIQDYQFIPTHDTEDKRFMNGTMILKMKAAA